MDGTVIENYLPRWSWRFLPKRVQKRLALVSIRESLLFFGYDLSTVSDEELEENMVTAAHLIAKAMPTVKEVSEAFRQFVSATGEVRLADILPGPGGESTVE